MEAALEVLVPIGMFLFMAAIFGFVIYSWRHTNKRDDRSDRQQEELVQFVQGRGWSHTPSVPGGADRYCGGPPLPIEGENLPVSDYIAGEFRGRSFCCFEYHSRQRDVDGPDQLRYFAVFAVTMPASGPRITIERPRALDRLNARIQARVFGTGQVVELGVPAFDEEFRVIADDEAFARNVLNGYLAQFLTTDPRAKDEPLRFHGNELITWYEGRIRPEQIDPKLNYLCDVLDRRPAQA